MATLLSRHPEPGTGRRRSLLWSMTSVLFCLGVGAWFVLRRRSPALPAFVQEAGPGPEATTAPSPQVTAPETPAEPAAEPPAEPAAEPVPVGDADAQAEELARVSGLGRRSAEALVAAGIRSLAELAAADDEALGAALDAAGLPHATTMSSWPGQARRLQDG